jgi:uncharacterized YccA/Bax inhibitor family protein
MLQQMVKSPWDLVNVGFTLALHLVFVVMGFFVFASDYKTACLNVGLQTLGITIGWWIGMLISPSSSRHQSDMATVGKAVTAFVISRP